MRDGGRGTGDEPFAALRAGSPGKPPEARHPPSPIPLPPSLLFVNGVRADPDAPALSAHDRGFTLADGLFETMRAYDGRVFRLPAHIARLRDGLETLGIALADGQADPRAAVEVAVREAVAAGLREAAVRLTVTRGPASAPGLAPPPAGRERATVVVAVYPAPAIPAACYTEGLTVCVPTGRRNEHAMTAGLKTLAYTDAVLALAEARGAGSDDALMLDTAGHLSEASASNVFLYAGGRLATPPVSCGALPGITRAAVMECAATLGVPCDERELAFAELRAADEAFLTSSLREIAPLVKADDHRIGGGTPGPVTRAIMGAYREMVRRECSGP